MAVIRRRSTWMWGLLVLLFTGVLLARHLQKPEPALAARPSLAGLQAQIDTLGARLDDVEGDFPPFETNRLYHYRGCMTFRQRPFTQGPFYKDLRILLADDFRQDGRSTVFAKVTEGLELLDQIAGDEKTEESPTRLANPIQITEVVVSLPGLQREP